MLIKFYRICNFSCIFLFVLTMCSCASVPKLSVTGACYNNAGSPIKNFCVVTPNVLWRGSRPDKDDAAWLIQHGVKTVVNLELILDDKLSFVHSIVKNIDTCSVGYFRIHDWEPLPKFAPSVEDDNIAHFLAIVIKEPKPVYVHCRHGVNRTGVMTAAYRVLFDGVSNEEAIEEMGRYRGLWFEADSKYIRELTPKRLETIKHQISEWLPKLEKNAQIVCLNGTCSASDQ